MVGLPDSESLVRITVFDTTILKETKLELHKINKMLTQKNNELQQILYVASHDLRTPLVNIEGFSREIEVNLNDVLRMLNALEIGSEIKFQITEKIENDVLPDFKIIKSSADKMGAMIKGLLEVSRIGQIDIKLEVINVNELILELKQTLLYQLNEASVNLQVDENLPECYADANLLSQVFVNILENSIKYKSTERNCEIKIKGYKEKEFSVYEIQDNGLGIKEKHQEKVFEIFYRLYPEINQGLGLGMTIISRIIEKLNGEINLKSEFGKGTTVILKLPFSKNFNSLIVKEKELLNR